MTQPNNEPVAVTVEDREAALTYWAHSPGSACWRQYASGRLDDDTTIQAFARHRLQSTRTLTEQLAQAREALEERAAGPWVKLSERHPPKDVQVLVQLREGVGGFVCDVACYVGRVDTGNGAEDRWILADIRLDSRQIKAWAEIIDTEAALRARTAKEPRP